MSGDVGTVVLEARGVSHRFGPAPAPEVLRELDLQVRCGEVLALVGGSGAGKTTLLDILQGQRRPIGGSVYFDAQDLYSRVGPFRRQAQRGIQMIFQDPYDALPPRMRVGRIVEEPLRIHRLASSAVERQQIVHDLLEQVALTPSADFAGRWPAELSGGQRQRVAMAAALAAQPRVLLADEPVAMLDVSLKADILGLLAELASQRRLAVLLVTHDLATVGSVADRIAVLQAGQIVEQGAAEQVLQRPAHAHTRSLLRAARDLTME